MTIRLPRLLDDHLNEVTRLHPLQLSLHLTLAPLSTAEMRLPHEAPSIYVRDLVELYDEQGSVGVFRVTAVQEELGRIRRIQLEHSFATLRDTVIPAQGFTGTVRETLTHLLNQQTLLRWTLGDVELPEDMTIIYATEYANLLTAVWTLLDMLPEGYAPFFEQQGSTWLLHLRALSDTPACEGRIARNLQSLQVDTDGSRLCTRVYPFGAEVETGRINLVPLEGTDHLCSGAEADWGVISRTFENDLIFDVPTLKSVAEMYLDRHAQPEVTLTVSAVDLSRSTGEDIDAFRLGRMCRLALPDFGQALCQRIVAIDKEDVYGTPGQVTLTLTNRLSSRNEMEEIDELVRQVTAGKLLGGTVTEVENSNRAHGSFTSPVVHYFTIENWASVLDVRISFKADSGVSIRDVQVDSMPPEDEVWKSGSFSAMPYLKRDELGQIAQGEHWVSFLPYGANAADNCGVNSTVTMTVIEKTVS